MRTTKISRLGWLLAATWAASGCAEQHELLRTGDPDAGKAEPPGKIKVEPLAIGFLSGEDDSDEQDAFEIAVQQVNQLGDQRIELRFASAQAAGSAQAALTELAGDSSVRAIVSSLSSSDEATIEVLAKKLELPVVSAVGFGHWTNHRDANRWHIGLRPALAGYLAAMVTAADMAPTEAHCSRVGVLLQGGDRDADRLKVYELASELGFSIEGFISFASEAVGEFRDAPDCILVEHEVTVAATKWLQARAFSPTRVYYADLLEPEVFAEAPEFVHAVRGARSILAANGHVDRRDQVAFEHLMELNFIRRTTREEGRVYDATWLASLATLRASVRNDSVRDSLLSVANNDADETTINFDVKLSPSGLADYSSRVQDALALDTVNYDGVSGSIEFGEHPTPIQRYGVYQINDLVEQDLSSLARFGSDLEYR